MQDCGVTRIVLSIAGSDPFGGAGVQADLKTFHAHGVYGMAAIALLTAQNSLGVHRVEHVSPQFLADQLSAVFGDATVNSVKTGALGTAAHVEIVAEQLAGRDVALVIDPVMVSKSGAVLLDADGCNAVRECLFPLATLVTPNLDEVELLLGRGVRERSEINRAARELRDWGARAVLVKGGHRQGAPIDVLCLEGDVYELHAPRVATRHTHGVGCTLSAAIAARLALGEDPLQACALAKEWLTRTLATAPGVGAGQGAVDHLVPVPEGSASGGVPLSGAVTVVRLSHT